jgi:hypothetical protein
VPVAHEQLARYYSIEDVAFTYTTDLLEAMRRALDTPDDRLAAMRVSLEGVKQRYLRDSQRDLQQALVDIGVYQAAGRVAA